MAHDDDTNPLHLATDPGSGPFPEPAGRQRPIPEELVELSLKCCCCGRVLERLLTHWRTEDVRPESIWTRSPCSPCESRLREDPNYTRWIAPR